MKKLLIVIVLLLSLLATGCTKPLSLGEKLYSMAVSFESLTCSTERYNSDYEPTTVTVVPPEKMGGVKFTASTDEETGSITFIPNKNVDSADQLEVISYLTDHYGKPFNYEKTYVWANADDSFKIVLAVWDASEHPRGMVIRVTGAQT